MSDREQRAEIIKSGRWTYAETREYEVWIVQQNFEYYYEGWDDSERLNDQGESYVVLFADDGRLIGGPSEHSSLAEAIAHAETAVPQGIRWDNHRLQPLYGGREYRLDQ